MTTVLAGGAARVASVVIINARPTASSPNVGKRIKTRSEIGHAKQERKEGKLLSTMDEAASTTDGLRSQIPLLTPRTLPAFKKIVFLSQPTTQLPSKHGPTL